VIILSLEGVFAAIGGWLVLNEVLSIRDGLGCLFIFCGTLVSQFWGKKNQIQ
jgi:drug/metabolite transporter (DMT)-like permease